MATQEFSFSLSKLYKRHYTPEKVEQNAAEIFAAVNTRSLKARGWHVEHRFDDDGRFITETEATGRSVREGYLYEVRIAGQIAFDVEGKAVPPMSEVESIARTIAQKAALAPVGAWLLDTLNGKPYKVPENDGQSSSMDEIGYVEVHMPDDFEDYFSHLYGVDSHIAMVKSAVEAGIMSHWTHRFHCLLQGPPGCGKSEICRSVKKAFGDDAVMEFDATATTAAGAIKDISEREILPRILIVEEIEKADPKALSFLLGVLDLRGEIRKTTARANIQRDTKLFVIATCNDFELFNSLQAGALSSRFANPIHFKRPGREMLARILTREIAKVNGSLEWIEPTLTYCADELHISDPRVIIARALCGRDKWLTGDYVKMLKATADPNVIN